MNAPYLIGLTGGIGSGKSTVADELAKLGAEVVSGDQLGRKALENSPELLAQIRARFGGEVFDAKGNLLRRVLGDKVFADPDSSLWLTHLTFPAIHRLWREAAAHSTKPVVVLDAALIFEWGIESEFDVLLVVQAAKELVESRMVSGGRFTLQEIEARTTAQISPEIKAQKADVVLVNNGSLPEFQEKIRAFWTIRVMPELQHRRVRKNGSFC